MSRKTRLQYWRMKFTLFGHILNPLWHSRLRRRQTRGYWQHKVVDNYLREYKDFVRGLKLDGAPTQDGSGEKIFSIWFQGEDKAPKLVKKCFARLRKFYGDRFVVLDNTTLPQWISLPEHIERKWKEGKIVPANYSDICRIELLHQHGGMWFDATDYLTERVPQWVEDADLFIYLEGGHITPHTFIQSCFMRAKKGHPLFGAWRELISEYWRHEDEAVDYFLAHFLLRFLVENNEEAARLFHAMPQVAQDPTHRLWFGHRDEPYSEELYRELTKDAFFQKTNFKCKSGQQPAPGTMADFIINGND